MPVTQAEMDAENFPELTEEMSEVSIPTPSLEGPRAGGGADIDTFDTTPQDNPITMENIASNPYDIPMNIDDPGASIENLIALNPSGTIGGAPDVFDIDKTGDPTTTMLDVPTDTVGLAYTGEFDPDDEGTVFNTTSITPEDTEESITQKIANFLNVDTDKLNKSAVTSALNLVAGKALDTVIPIGTVFNLITDAFTKSPEEIAAEEQARQDNIDEAAAITQRLEDEVTPQDIIDDRG